MTHIFWFRQDLRLADNPALAHAASRGELVPVYILDDAETFQQRAIGGASRWWLHHSLEYLKTALGGLVLLRGDPIKLLPDLVHRVGAKSVSWNRCYEPYAIARDKVLKADLNRRGCEVASFNGSLLFEPWQIKTKSGGPFKVYSPFWRACLRAAVTRPSPAPPVKLAGIESLGDKLKTWSLLPTQPNWAKTFKQVWEPGEAGAHKRLRCFLDKNLADYGNLRNRPDLEKVSRLSPHLHWGEISPQQVWAATFAKISAEPNTRKDGEKFLSEIGWREFSYHLLYHFPALPKQNWKPEFDAYPWRNDPKQLAAWRRGQTGYPIVDAGMRELWATGYMHNRVRMVAASFLVKDLMIDWREGEAWFWDTLLDADLANNAASWQWVAGCGADAAPYFRIFNPTEQGRKFDPEGSYVRRWCPELTSVPTAFIHAPFDAPREILAAAGVVLGKTYPHPLVNHATARRAALAAYSAIKEEAGL